MAREGTVFGKLLVWLGANTKPLSDALKSAETRLRRTGSEIARLGRDFTQGLSLPFVAAGYAINRVFGGFEKAMATSTAIMADLSQEMRADLARTARDVAQRSTFGADEAARAYYYLASAGLDAAQSLKALPQVVQFATAGQFDLARATDLLTDAQSALGLTVRESTQNLANMGRVADVLIKANTLANASTAQFAEALTTDAAAALRILSKDVEEGVAVLAAFADQGTKASEAGTQLAIFLRDIQKANLGAREAWEKHGLAVYDTQGKVRNLADILEDLEGALGGLSDEQKKATLSALDFQEKSVKAVLALLGYSAKIREYERALRSATGTSATVAARQLDNIADRWTMLKHRVEDLAISLGQALAPTFRQVQSILEGMISTVKGFAAGIERWPEPLREALGTVGLLTAALGPLTLGLGWLIKAAASAVGGLRLLAVAFTALAAHPLLVLITALGVAVAAMVGFREEATAAREQTDLWGSSVAAAADSVGEAEARVERYREAISSASKEIERLTGKLMEAQRALDALDPGNVYQAKDRAQLRSIIEEIQRLIRSLEEEGIVANRARLAEAEHLAQIARVEEAYRTYYSAEEQLKKRFEATGDELENLNRRLAAAEKLFDDLTAIPELPVEELRAAAVEVRELKRARDDLMARSGGLKTTGLEAVREAFRGYSDDLARVGRAALATGDQLQTLDRMIGAKEGLFEKLLDIPETAPETLKEVAASIARLTAERDKLAAGPGLADILGRPDDAQAAAALWEDWAARQRMVLTQLSEFAIASFSNLGRGLGNALGQAAVGAGEIGELVKTAFRDMAAQAIAHLAQMAIEQIAYHALVKGLLSEELATFIGVKSTETAVQGESVIVMFAEWLWYHVSVLALWAAELVEFIAVKCKEIFLSIVAAFAALGPWGWILGLAIAGGAIAGIMAAVGAFAEGGIVKGPTLGLVGEAGPEAIIPLRDLPRFTGGAGETRIILELDGRTLAEVVARHTPGVIRRRIG